MTKDNKDAASDASENVSYEAFRESGSNEITAEEVLAAIDDKRLFRAVFDHTFQFMGVLSPDGVLLDANKTALNFVGVRKDEVVDKPFWETPWWANSPKAQAQLKEAIALAAQGEVVRFDAEHISPEGSLLVVDFSLTPVPDKFGNVALLVAEGRDITERIIAERSLKEREARNRALVDTAPVGICTVTMDGIIESANSSLHKLLGYPKFELNGQPVACILENLYGHEPEKKGDILKTGERRIFGVGRETTALHRNGTVVPVELALSLLNLGHVHVFIVIVRDLSELRKSQQLQAQLAAIVESSDDAIFSCNIDSVVTSWNPAAESMYGYKAAEAIGESVVKLIVPDDRVNEVDGLLEHIRKGESIGHFETVRKDSYGTLFDVDMTISPIRNTQGQIVGVSTIARDISARKEAERRISEFYSMVSHELRTPLTSIRASLGLLEGGIAGNIDDEALRLVEIARAESDRLILLINDILDLRKIEAGMLELKLRKVVLSTLMSSVLQSLRAMADEYGVKLSAQYPDDYTFVADHDRVIQVIHNFLSNAIKYSPKDSTVELNAKQVEANRLRISVSDRGPGIRADQMHKLFGKFQQLDSSDARPQGGTGLGLAISKAIVEQHGGTVGVKTKPGEGSTFWFEIPMNHEPSTHTNRAFKMTGTNIIMEADKQELRSKDSKAKVNEERSAAAMVRHAGPAFILIVEDDKSTLELLTKQLERLKIKCVSATDGDMALKILSSTKPDLLILDLGVPAPDGFEIVRSLQNSPHRDLPLLVYTSLDLNESDREQLTLGPSKHMIKSMTSQEDIIQAVKELLGPLAQGFDTKA